MQTIRPLLRRLAETNTVIRMRFDSLLDEEGRESYGGEKRNQKPYKRRVRLARDRG